VLADTCPGAEACPGINRSCGSRARCAAATSGGDAGPIRKLAHDDPNPSAVHGRPRDLKSEAAIERRRRIGHVQRVSGKEDYF
jgi:hypothetical protein